MATSVTLKPNAIDISGSTSGTTTLQASAVAGTTTLTLPAATDTLVGKATTDTLTNKTLTGAVMNGTLGATAPSTASVTTLTTSSTVTHSGGTANGVAYLDGSKVLTTGSALVFDGTNFGLGVTPSAWTNYTGSQVGALGGLNLGGSVDDSFVGSNVYYNVGYKFARPTTATYATMYRQTGGVHSWQTSTATGTAGNAITFTQAMTLDASGRLGIGTTSPVTTGGSLFEISNSVNCLATITCTNDTTSLLDFRTNAVDRLQIQSSSNWGAYFLVRSNQDMKFGTNNTERARIDSSGNLLVGVTSFGNSSGGVQLNSGAVGAQLKTSATATTTWNHYQLYNANGNIGSISTSGSTTTYSTSSDYRLKENITPMVGALEKVTALKPCTYTWKVDGLDGEGFIAHELAEICPHAVIGEKDGVDEEGNPVYQGIDTSFLVATLTAAIQEMKAIIDTQASTITQLQADVAALKGA